MSGDQVFHLLEDLACGVFFIVLAYIFAKHW